MTDRERISNLEEMVADILLKLDEIERMLNDIPRLEDYNEYNLKTLEEGLLELAKKELVLNDRQTLLEKSFALLMEVCRRNSEEIEAIRKIRDAPQPSDNNAELFEFLMSKFDAVDERFQQLDIYFRQIDERFRQVDERFEQIDKQFNRFKRLIYTRTNRLEFKLTQQEDELKKISLEIQALGDLVNKLKTEVDSIKNKLFN
ncbi:hypothetical protein SAMN04487996_104217 [Dyadobacter soli]|uniref:Uncharacterized protein n=1 Tax=Dyadobacter soli TaxID=659014 RepID=A0A1G7BJ70_9BACT|nr:hypothetical protein [Dyadobacter soli]SDE26992.1 hypothetical protein SAMN04487996_104217 [Dyadobacter soli]